MSVAEISIPKLVTIPAGEFVMGAGEDDKFATMLELPRRRVVIERPFAMGKFPVTFAQWDEYVALNPGAHCPPDYDVGRGDLPVGSVSWNDVQEYLAWLRHETGRPFRLPTEAEWEYACRAGTVTTFNTGDDLTTEQANYWYSENGKKIGPGKPLPVGSYPPNAFGLYDMHGTICELVADSWHDGYADLPTDGSPYHDPESHLVVTRGGAWDYAARLLRSAFRDWVDRARRFDNIGFRVACDIE